MSMTEPSCEKCDRDRRALERLLAAVLAVVDAGIVVFDESGRFVMANPSFIGHFHWRNGGLHDECFGSLFPDTRLPSSVVRLPRSVSAGRYRTRMVGGNGSLIDVEVNARWITHEDQESFWVAALTRIVDAPAAEQPASWSAGAARGSQAGDFERAVLDRVREGPLGPYAIAGQVEVTKLDVVRKAAGERWPQVASHIYAEAESIVTRNLSASDAFTHDAAGTFTICFGDGTLAEAEQRAVFIEQEIRDHLSGCFGVAAAPDAGSQVEQILLPSGPVEEPDLGALIASRLAEKRSLIERLSNLTLAQVIEAASLELQEVVSSVGTRTPLLTVRLNRATSRAVRKAAAVSSDVRSIAAQIDHLLLGLVATRIYENMATMTPPTFIVPVSFATFTNRRLLNRYIGLCRDQSSGIAQHIMFELVDVPNDVAGMRMEEIVASLRLYSRYQCLRLPGLERGLARPWERHFNQFTVSFECIEASRRDREALLSLVNALHLRRSRLIVQDVPDQAAARWLADSGVDLVSGAGLVPWATEG